jgi:hypothetical protein
MKEKCTTDSGHFKQHAAPLPRLLMMFALTGVLFFATYHTSAAQFELKMQKFTDPDQVVLTPPFPSPGETVIATLTSPTDLKASYVVWSLDGTVVQQSNSGLSYTFTAGKAGSTMVIAVVASGGGMSESVTAAKSFVVNDIQLLWEAKTYTPPLYAGRALLSPGAEATALVVPSVYTPTGTLYNPAALRYKWRVDADARVLAEGVGVTSVTVKSSQLYKPINVSVDISDTNEVIIATKNINIPLVQPKILFYEDNRLSGTRYATALSGEYSLSTSEATIVGEPFFMSAPRRDDTSLSYVWQIDTLTQTNPGSIVLRPEGTGAGKAKLNLVIMNKNYLAQRIRGELSILFTSQAAARETNTNTTPL